MKRIIGALGALALCSLGYSQGAITAWTVQADIIPGNQTQMAGAAVVGGKVFLCGGNDGIDGDTNRVYRFAVNNATGALGLPDSVTTLSGTIPEPLNYPPVRLRSPLESCFLRSSGSLTVGLCG